MDRQTVYSGQVPLETDLLNTNRNVLVALGKVLGDMLGTSTFATGLGCVPTAPASMSVQVQPGQLYSLQNLDNTAYSSLAADTTHQIVKQGIALDAQSFACAAPTTAGYSINYLIEANYSDVDTNAIVLPFYNASNPSQAFNGPGGNGQPSMTTRAGKVILTLKPGVAAATGAQITPAVDAGCVGLWVVTVAYGQSTITAGNISQYTGAPILPTSLLQSLITNNLEYGIDAGPANTVQATFPIAPMAVVDNQQFWVKIKSSNTGATTFTPNPGVIGALPVVGAAHQALQGGELVANGRALFVYRSDIASYVLESCTGAAMQTAPATQSGQAVQKSQLGNFQAFYAYTSSQTLTASQAGSVINFWGGSPSTFSLPACSSMAAGGAFLINNSGAAVLTVTRSGTDSILCNGGSASIVVSPGDNLLVFVIPPSQWIATGGSAQLPFAGTMQRVSGGVVGAARNAYMNVSAASASATYTADEVVVETVLGGTFFRLAGFNKAINLTTTGAGGMDTGAAPTSGYVALYAIYNATTQASALLATNATSAVAPSVYGGAYMPAGYTASALVSVWPTNGSGQFVAGVQIDRQVAFPTQTVLSSSTTQASVTSLSISSAVPPNARKVSGTIGVSSTSSTPNTSLSLYASNAGVGIQGVNTSVGAAGGNSVGYKDLLISVSQTIYYTATSSAGTPSFTATVSGYEF